MNFFDNSQKIPVKFLIRSLLAITFLFSAQNAFSENRKITLSDSSVTLKAAFEEIEKQTGLSIDYEESRIDVGKRVSGSIVEMDLEKALAQVLKDSGYTYTIKENHIIVSSQAPQQSNKVRITGQVTDAGGGPVIGAVVGEKGVSGSTITDHNGNFSMEVSPGAVLTVTLIGYSPVEVAVGNQRNLSIRMVEDVQAVEEVVVVGYGVQRKSDVTGSISVATADDILAGPVFNALEGLRGKAAGVNIFSSTGNPMGLNGEGPRVVIRGINSINTSSDPLYVVDGVQMNDIHFVNPNDIERIEVLKDASATAIYGARGANGVILVTTSRGKVGDERTSVTYNGWVSLGQMAEKVPLMNAAEFMELEEIGFANIGKYPAGRRYLSTNGLTSLKPNRTDPLIFDANGNPLYDTDWQDEVTRNAWSHSHQLNIQHQGIKSSVGAFVNYTDQQGIILNNYAKRANARLTFDSKPLRWLDITTNLMVNHTWGNTIDDSGGGQTARRTMWEMPPIIPVKFPDGSWGGTQFAGSKLNYGLESMANPVQELTTSKRTRLRTKIFGNLGFTLHLADGLDLRTQFGVDANFIRSKDFFPNDLLTISSPYGQASISSRENLYWQEETFLSYNKVFNDIHRVNATLGMSWSKFVSSGFGTGNIREFSSNFFGYDNLGAGLRAQTAPTSDWSSWAMNSYFARASYSLKDKYLTTLTLRADGSSRFGANNKYGFFPSVGLGWVASNENFLKDAGWLSFLKLHTSYGQTGNSEIEVYRSLALMTVGTTLINNGRAGSAQMAAMPNPDLSWEKTTQFDVGINLALFKNRVELELDYYYKKTDDLLLERPLPFTTGFASVWENMGRVDNSGIDFMLTTRNIDSKDFKWETTLNLNHNRNEVKRLGKNNEDIIARSGVGGGNILLRVGEPLGNFYTQRRLGLWSTAEAEEAAKSNLSPGEAKRSKDREIVGNGMPKYTGSLINKFYYKNFDLIVDLQFVAGVDAWEIYYGTVLDRSGIANGLNSMLKEGWREDRQNTMVQQIRHANFAGQSSASDSSWVTDGSYLRGNLLQLGYTFGKELTKKWGVQNMRLNFSVQNAFLLHSKEFRGYDPEGSSSAGKWGQNIFFYQYPRARTYILGVNFSF